jgi:hypothetical protein
MIDVPDRRWSGAGLLQDGAGDGMPRSRPAGPGLPTTLVNTLGMKFKLIPAGKFRMGSSQAEIDYFVNRTKDEGFRRMVQEGRA